jgi:hypothetical protein
MYNTNIVSSSDDALWPPVVLRIRDQPRLVDDPERCALARVEPALHVCTYMHTIGLVCVHMPRGLLRIQRPITITLRPEELRRHAARLEDNNRPRPWRPEPVDQLDD